MAGVANREIPVLDMREYLVGHNRWKFINEFGRALTDTGFAVIENHLISKVIIYEAIEETRELFALGQKKLLRYEHPEISGQRGYTSFGTERAMGANEGDLKEFWMIGPEDYPDKRYENIWPTELRSLEGVYITIFRDLEKMGRLLLNALEQYLGLQPDELEKMTHGAPSILRALHYPKVTVSTGTAIRSAAHEDINLLTLLVPATHAGLEVMGADNTWYKPKQANNAIIVNVGDMLKHYTEGQLTSTTHRVMNTGIKNESRFSLPFFLHAHPDTVLDKNTGKTAREFLDERLEAIGVSTLRTA